MTRIIIAALILSTTSVWAQQLQPKQIGITGPAIIGNSSSGAGSGAALPIGTGVAAALGNAANIVNGFITNPWGNAYYTDSYGNSIATAVTAATGGGTVVIPPASGAVTSASSIPDNVLVIDQRLGTAVAGTSIASPYSILGHNSAAKNDLQVMNPAATIYDTVVMGDVLGASSSYNQQATLAIESVNNQPSATTVALFTFAASEATGAAVFGANFGAGNTAGHDASITGLELDLDNNITGGGSASKIGLAINSFNNSINSGISLNGLAGGGFNQVIKMLSNAGVADGSLIASDGQSAEPAFGVDFHFDTFTSAAILLKYGNYIAWEDTSGINFIDDLSMSSDDTFTVGNVAGNLSLVGSNVFVSTLTTAGFVCNGATYGELSTSTTPCTANLDAQPVFASSTTGATTETFTNSPCSGSTTEQWIPISITGQTGTWYVPSCK